MGAISNRLSSVVDNNTSMVTNTVFQEPFLDTDFAVETTKLTRTQILQQAATSMLAQGRCIKAVSTSAPSKLRIKNFFKYLQLKPHFILYLEYSSNI